MILVIPALIYIFALTFIYGSVATISLDRILAPPNKQSPPWAIVNITGIVVLGVVAGYLSLFMNIGMVANIIISVTAFVLYLAHRREINHLAERYLSGLRTANRFAVVIFFLICALILIEVVDRPKVGDSGLYHIQTIKWIESYGVIPGLGNLHGMYALNSMWYPLSALFGFSFFGIQSLHVINGMLFIFAVGFFVSGVIELLNGSSASTSIIKAAAIPFSLFLYKPHLGSPSTDMPVALLIWVAFILCLENVNSDNNTFRSRTTNFILVALISYIFTIKLSALPIVILYLYLFYLQYKAKKWTELWLQAGLGLVILIPWVVRNIILSGYLIYPFPYIDLFNVDWKLPYQYVIEEKLGNHGWARLPGPHWRESLDMSLSEWFPKWLDWLYYRYRIIIIATFLSMLVYIPVTALRSRGQTGWTNTREILYLIGCAGVIYWFTNAPDPRFGWGFIFIAFIIPVAPLLQQILVRFKAASRLCMLSILILYILDQSYISIRAMPKTTDIFWLPVPYPVEELWSERIGNVVFYGARTGFCWDAPLPCTPILNDQIYPRGDSLKSGFRIAKTKALR